MLIYYVLFLINIITYPIFLISKKVYLLCNLLVLWMIMGCRSFSVGIDTFSYVLTYESSTELHLQSRIISWVIPVDGARYENGFIALNKILYSINPNPRFFLLVTSAIMIGCFAFFMFKLNINYFIGIITFETMNFFSYYMNGMRQALACSLCMVAFVYAVKRAPIRFLIFTYLAISIHVTAIVFLLVYLFGYLGNSKKIYIPIFFLFGIIIYEFESIFSKISLTITEANTYSSLVQNNDTLGWTNIILSLMLILFILFINEKIQDKEAFFVENPSLKNFSIYMLLFAAGFYLVSLKFSQISRISLYFLIGYFPIFTNIFQMKNKNIYIKIIIVLFMIIYFIVIQTYRPEWNGIVPYAWM